MKKRALCLLLTVMITLGLMPVGIASAASTADQDYYQSQLLTDDARTIYDIFDTMALDSGTQTVTLSGVQTDNHEALLSDFIAARDAYMLDHPDLFYVDFDKMSITQEGSGVTMGIGREDTYFHDGFNADNVDSAISTFHAQANSIASIANNQNLLKDKIKAAYNAVIASCSYALEADVTIPGNETFVRIPYGALVTGEAVCAGYAQALKVVLDKMGVTNVLVQGVYDDGTYKGPHMWNYVRMDDFRWYMLDATMEDGLRESTNNAASESFFLITGLDKLMDAYQPNGVVSLSSKSMEFSYPDLSIKEYEALSNAFTASGDSVYNQQVSYKGMGLAAAQETTMKDEYGNDKPIYILGSFNGSLWFYCDRYLQVALATMGAGPEDDPYNPVKINLTDLGYDTDTYFMGMGLAYFGVTTIAPEIAYDSSWTTATQMKAYYVYEGGLLNIHDTSLVGEAQDLEKAPPYITEKTPYNSRLDQGKTYNVTVTYNEDLKKANTELPVELTWVQEVNGGTFANFKWWGDDVENPNSRKVTFTLTTGKNFGRTTNYYFELQNLVGKESGKAPNAIGFSTYNNNVFECPKIEGDPNKIHANTPALISNEDLSENQWIGADGKPLGDLPQRLSLVATTIEKNSNEQTTMVDAIETSLGEGSVLAAQTFEITMSLCSSQVAYIEGKPLQVYVPFPEGYSAASEGVIFKAYHFDKNGNPEEIQCKVVEGGIIMYCTKFSPFAVIATKGTPGYTVSFNANGGSGNMDSVANDTGSYPLPECTFTAPEGMQFKGWALTADGDVITDTSITIESNITLYAIWEALPCEHTGGKATCQNQAVCDICKQPYGDKAEHNYNIPDHDETSHWNKCQWCDEVSGEAVHSGGEATCQVPAVCDICKQPYGDKAEHNYNTLKYNENQHWYQCQWCEEVSGETTHSGGEATCQALAACDICKQPYGDKAEHNYNIPDHDEDSHWNKCQWCDESDAKAAHSGGAASCQKMKECAVCGVEYGQLAEHNYNNLQKDETQHWYQCQWCNEISGTVDHSGGTATCQNKAHCALCSTAYGDLGNHNWNQTYITEYADAEKHYLVCQTPGCGIKNDGEAHDPNVEAATEETAKYCEICSYVMESKKEHVHTGSFKEEIPAGCTNEGTKEHYVCEGEYGCGKEFSDKDCIEEITDHTVLVIPSLGHDFETGSTYSKDETGHAKKCSRCDTYDDAVPHSGGTANCQTKKVCETCGQSYGEVDASNHQSTDFLYESSEGNAVNHIKRHTCCEAVADAADAHIWGEDSICDLCDYDNTHYHSSETFVEGWDADCATGTDGQMDYYICSCGNRFYNEACTQPIEADTDLVIPWAHTGGTANCMERKKCTVCGNSYGDVDSTNHSSEGFTYEVIDEQSHKKLHECCEAVADADENHVWGDDDICDLCGYDNTHYCSGTLKEGWDADCKTETNGHKAYYQCTCGKKYYDEACTHLVVSDSELVIAWTHAGSLEWIQTAASHKQIYTCCSTVVVAEENHEWTDGVCSECGYSCQHTGGTASCTNPAICDICFGTYGEKDSGNHISNLITYTNNGENHTATRDCCKAAYNEAHTYVDGKCVCGAEKPAEEPDDRDYVEISLEVDAKATATQNGLSHAMSDADITVKNGTIVSVSMTVSAKASSVKPWWSGWFGNWWGSSNGKTTYDHTITFTGENAGTTIVQVGNVYYKVTVTEPHVHAYTSDIIKPTCTDKGYTTYTCECGDSYVSDYVDALGHNYEDSVCGNCGEQEPQKPTTFAPKTFSASISKSSVNVGKSATITVKTSTDVEYVTINGQKITSYKTTTSGWGWNRTTCRTFTYTVSEKAAGTYQYEIFAFNADNAQSDTSRTIKLTVKAFSISGIGSGWWWWK